MWRDLCLTVSIFGATVAALAMATGLLGMLDPPSSRCEECRRLMLSPDGSHRLCHRCRPATRGPRHLLHH